MCFYIAYHNYVLLFAVLFHLVICACAVIFAKDIRLFLAIISKLHIELFLTLYIIGKHLLKSSNSWTKNFITNVGLS